MNDLVLYCITFLVLLIIVVVVVVVQTRGISSPQRMTPEEEEREKELKQIASGEWNGFPYKRFYASCTVYGVYNLDSAFAVQKATAVAKQLLTDDVRFPDEFIDQYCSAEKVKEYWTRGKEIADQFEARCIAKQREPQRGQLPEAESQSVSLANRLKLLFGTQKRIAMLDDAIQKIDKRIHDIEEGQEALKLLAYHMSASVTQEKKKDWAVLGGLADAIGGPGAGAAVAVNAMIENQEIERRNQQARMGAIKLQKDLNDSAYKMSSDIDELNSQKKLLENQKRQAKVKVVLDQYSTDEIFKALTISSSVSKLNKGKATKLSVSIRNKFVADVPEGVVVAVDGTLDAKIFFEGTLVDTVCVCLPLFGVATGATENVVAVSPQYVEADGKYSVEFMPNKIWVIEV